jgi:YHS domain-containing protein
MNSTQKMKPGVMVLAMSVLAANLCTATGSQPESMRLRLASIHEGTQIWIEKGAPSKINTDKNRLILKGYDVVAYFSQSKAIKGSSKYESLYQGAKYHFSSATNQAIFEKNPSRYVPQYGAFCADGLTEGKLEDIDPTVFFIRQGKLYFCSSKAELKTFRAKEEEDIVTANRNWLQLGH